MTSVCRIVADVFERRSGVVEALRDRGVSVETRRLEAGDYALPGHVLVERKTVLDLHESIRHGRLWGQIGGIRRAARLPYFLVEGPTLDDGSLAPEAIRGACLAVIGQGIPLVRSADATDTACWLHLLAARVGDVRSGRDRPVYAQRLRPPDELVREAMLAVVPGISVHGARALLGAFGSVAGVAAAGYDAWLAVPGIGPARASALRQALG
jgi:ERCC4-type nuclease